MIVKCPSCPKFFDDQFRTTICPHDTFSANDGWNNFKHYPESWLADSEPKRTVTDMLVEVSEHDAYEHWLAENRVKI